MSKAFRKVKKTREAPNFRRFQQRDPGGAPARDERLRAIAQRLASSGRNLADATQNPPLQNQERDRT